MAWYVYSIRPRRALDYRDGDRGGEPLGAEPVVAGGDGSRLKSGAWVSWSLVIGTFNWALLPLAAGTSRNSVKSIATSLAPRPRTPPTPTMNALTCPLLSSKMSTTSPTFWLSEPRTVVPFNFEASHSSLPWASTI